MYSTFNALFCTQKQKEAGSHTQLGFWVQKNTAFLFKPFLDSYSLSHDNFNYF